MSKYEIKKPIGLTSLCNEVESVCKNACVYKCGIRPKHLIVPLSAGSGRTTFVEYITDMYKKHGILDFFGSLDDYIEVDIDGSSSNNIVKGFASIRAGAVFKNNYSNIAVVNIEDMAKYLNAPQFTDFLREAKELCCNAYTIFFVSSVPTPNEEKLIAKLEENIGKSKICRAFVEKYTSEDICCLIEKTINEHSVTIECFQAFHSVLKDVVKSYNITEVKDAITVGEELIHYANFSGFTPTVDDKSIVMLADSRNKENKRSDSK